MFMRQEEFGQGKRNMHGNLMPVSEALDILLEGIVPLGVEEVPIDSVIGRVIGRRVLSPYSYPLFDNSSMDGFAVRSDDVKNASKSNPAYLKVVDRIPAGAKPNVIIGKGEAAQIMTGAMLPEGADTVVPVEDTNLGVFDENTAAHKYVNIFVPHKQGDNIRRIGSDFRKGEVIFEEGHIIRPQDVGMMAMLGMSSVMVYKKPIVAILSTGDELLDVDENIEPGKIYDANLYSLMSLVEQAGGIGYPLGIACDDPNDIKAKLDMAVKQQVDLIISTAGVSVGSFDYVRMVVEEHGKVDIWRVNMRPGKPFTFGQYSDIPFVGLPGNPVSSFVSFLVFVRPLLAKMSGVGNPTNRKMISAFLGENVSSDGRESYLRVKINQVDGSVKVFLTGHQGSGNLRSLVSADGLLVVPAGVKNLNAGEIVKVWLFA